MMKSFAENFFTSFGAQIYPLEDELVVDLPPDLAAVFGKPRLYLVFAKDGQGEPRELSPVEDLLVYGSRTFEQMLDLLVGRGEVAYLRLPSQLPTESEADLALPLPLHNCRLLEQQTQLTHDQFYIFNFRAAYLSDEKHEEFITVALDAEGASRPDKINELTGGAFFPPDRPTPVDPKTLRRLLNCAGEVAHKQAEARATELEAAIQPRLQRTLLRLTTFYRRLTDEVDTGDFTQDETVRADLQRDLTRKIADELERYRLRVTLSPLSYALALVPFAHYQLTLATRHSQQTLDLAQNLFINQLESFNCAYCQKPIDYLALCDEGHAVHPSCLDTCSRCDRDKCRACGLQSCAICGQLVCADCTAICAYCDRWLCAAHLAACAICGQAYCTAHSFRCHWCEQIYCAKCEQAGECVTCHAALASPVIVAEHIPVIPGIKLDRYQWRQAENQTFVIYMGRGQGFSSLWLGRVVIITDKAGEVAHRHNFGLWSFLFGRQ